MTSANPCPQCPDPWARAPRADGADGVDHCPRQRLHLAPPSLQGALVALIERDTRAVPLSDQQRLSHFPASPWVTLSWYQDMDAGLVERGADGPVWRPFGAPVMVAGSQSQAFASWAPTSGRGGIACFAADAAQALLGLDLAAVHDRFVPAREFCAREWAPLFEQLPRAADDAAVLALLEAHLAPRWQALQGRASALPSLRQVGRHWVTRLAWQAREWRRSHSPRHVERRIKSFSGRSLREWQSLTRTESLFFAARDRYEADGAIDWAALAQDEGYADQAHLVRAAKRITGFSPGEFTRRYIEDESFWMYRLWV